MQVFTKVEARVQQMVGKTKSLGGRIDHFIYVEGSVSHFLFLILYKAPA